jgi:melanoma-associated antigen p97
VPNNAIVTPGFQSASRRDIFWTLLNFAQQFFDADANEDFPMFDSYIDHKDLIFQDATVRLLPIAPGNQTYVKYLGEEFIRRMQRMKDLDCVTGSDAHATCQHSILTAITTILLTVRVFTTL